MLSKLILILSFSLFAEEPIKIGSKRFAENYILAEMYAQIFEDQGLSVERKFGLGGTMVAFDAVRTSEIDLYPEYTGTIAEAILKSNVTEFDAINDGLKSFGLEILSPLGFNNTYCLIMRKEQAARLNIKSIDDLAQHPQLKGALSAEFQGRKDGWTPLTKVYNLKNSVRSVEIPLTYEALKNEKVDFSEAYSTEPLIQKYDLVALEDNRSFFPVYKAVPLLRRSLPAAVKKLIGLLSEKVDDKTMMNLNTQVLNGETIPKVANDFLFKSGLIKSRTSFESAQYLQWSKLMSRTKDHIVLTLLAVLFATLIAVPLATWIAPYKKLSQAVLGITGVLQTIPSIALLTFMIPLFGIGFKPALVGLFIYSLLPIVRNTHVAMTTIDPRLITAARGIGLYPMEILLSVKLPLAFPTILTGIRTATTLNIGTATLAAFIGAGGLGEPIVTGLALNDTSLVLEGAIPAALLAIVVDLAFSLVDRVFTKDI